MQRQSLGSPSPKITKDEQMGSPGPSAVSVAVGRFSYGEECRQEDGEEEEEVKKMKIRQRTAEPGNYIHLIPLLTLLCFLILFLNSHKPTENDLSQFNGVKAFSHSSGGDLAVAENVSDVQGMAETKEGVVLAAATTAKQRRLHRKLGRF